VALAGEGEAVPGGAVHGAGPPLERCAAHRAAQVRQDEVEAVRLHVGRQPMGRACRHRPSPRVRPVLILLPPSESKSSRSRGKPADPTALSFRELVEPRRTVAAELAAVSARPDATSVLGVSPNLADEVAHNTRLDTAPALPVRDLYTRVLYDALDLAGMDSAARRRAAPTRAPTPPGSPPPPRCPCATCTPASCTTPSTSPVWTAPPGAAPGGCCSSSRPCTGRCG